MVRVVLTDEAREDIRDLDGSARKIVLRALVKLEDHPEQRGAPLGSALTTFRKLVVGDRQYRIVYRVELDGTVCVVWVVGSRVDAECYEIAKSRVQLYSSAEKSAALEALLDSAFEPAAERSPISPHPPNGATA